MLLAVSVFMLALFYFYPLTLRFYYTGQRARLQWLPRLCGGFAPPKQLRFGGIVGDNRLPPKAKWLLKRCPWRSFLPLLRWLPGHIRLERLYWRLLLAPTAPYGFSASVECILSMRCGDIIAGLIYALWLCKKPRTKLKV